MNKKFHSFIFILILFAYANTSFASLAETLGRAPKILTLGDSITVGCCNPSVGYQQFLAENLSNDGYSFSFVGSVRNAHGINIEGHGGFTPAQLANGIDNWLASSTPDIVLLHAGTNGITRNSLNFDPNTAQWGSQVNDVQTLLQSIVNFNPNTYVIVADIINKRTPDTQTSVFNEQLNLMLQTIFGNNSRISIVDFENLLDADPANNYSDAVHPAEPGFKLIADGWYTALTPILNSDSVSSVPIPTMSWIFVLFTGLFMLNQRVPVFRLLSINKTYN